MNLVKQGILSERELKAITNEVGKYRHRAFEGGVYDGKEGGVNKDTRDCLIYFTKPEESKQTHSILQSAIIEQFSDVPFPIDFSNISEVQYVRYNEGNFFKWHSDVITKRKDAAVDMVRLLTFSINLSQEEDYTGGELKVLHDNQEFTLGKQRGSFIIFPSFLYHQAFEVTSGTREAIVVWIVGPLQQTQSLRKFYEGHYGSVQRPEGI